MVKGSRTNGKAETKGCCTRRERRSSCAVDLEPIVYRRHGGLSSLFHRYNEMDIPEISRDFGGRRAIFAFNAYRDHFVDTRVKLNNTLHLIERSTVHSQKLNAYCTRVTSTKYAGTNHRLLINDQDFSRRLFIVSLTITQAVIL